MSMGNTFTIISFLIAVILGDPSKVTFGSVDCDRQVEVAAKYHITKYPTLKLVRMGQLAKKEYRGTRSPDAMAAFIESQLKDTYKEVQTQEQLDSGLQEVKKGSVIGMFTAKEGEEWTNLMTVAAGLREECTFFVGFGEHFKDNLIGGNNIAFRAGGTTEDQVFSGSLGDLDYTRQWLTDKCIPLVREITFGNAEELTEEGIPFLIMFRKPDDEGIIETYKHEVARQLSDQRTAVNFLYADGIKFAHPLHHLGKSEKDLPVLAIDSFRHMYVFPDVSQISVGDKLRQFIMDLQNGRLHREFHHGPDATEAPPAPSTEDNAPNDPNVPPQVQQPGERPPSNQDRTSPPESTFQKLKPSRSRYTILKEEL